MCLDDVLGGGNVAKDLISCNTGFYSPHTFIRRCYFIMTILFNYFS